MAMPIPGEVEIAERGEAIYQPDGEAMHELRVETEDPTTQIVVLDDRFNAVADAAGSIAVKLAAGLYKIRVQRGASSIGFEDRLVVLDRDTSVSVKPPQLSSPAPIGGTRATDAHVAAREWLDGVVHVRRGEGSKIALLARYAAPKQPGTRLLHPFHGLQLLRADGRLIVDLEDAAPKFYVPKTAAPISLCGIAVNPGAYILRHRLSKGRTFAQSLIATAGWQITMNIRRSQQDVDIKTKLFAGPGYVAPLVRRLINNQCADQAPMHNSKDGPIDEDQLVDIARQALADGAQMLSGNLYDLLLRDFENPLVGIFGCLLLDLEREATGAKFSPEHAAFFDVAVTKLRKMVGREHPDVEALSFLCQNPRLAHRGAIDARPMFHRSWRILLRAASKQTNLVPLELWKRTAASGTMPPYLIWSVEASVRRGSLRRLRQAASDRSTERVHAPMAMLEGASNVPPAGDIRVTSPPSESIWLQARSAAPPPVPAAQKTKTTKIWREELALEMGLPANVVRHLIDGPKAVAQSFRNRMEAKAADKRGGRMAGLLAAGKVAAKSAVSRATNPKRMKTSAKTAGSTGVKGSSKGAVAKRSGSKAKVRGARTQRSRGKSVRR
jgi:hypothetical protein